MLIKFILQQVETILTRPKYLASRRTPQLGGGAMRADASPQAFTARGNKDLFPFEGFPNKILPIS